MAQPCHSPRACRHGAREVRPERESVYVAVTAGTRVQGEYAAQGLSGRPHLLYISSTRQQHGHHGSSLYLGMSIAAWPSRGPGSTHMSDELDIADETITPARDVCGTRPLARASQVVLEVVKAARFFGFCAEPSQLRIRSASFSGFNGAYHHPIASMMLARVSVEVNGMW